MTKVIAVAMVKDEIDILQHVLDQLHAQGVDAFFIADNMSTDGTREWVIKNGFNNRYPNTPFYVVEDNDPAYNQSTKMNHFVRLAVEGHGHWFKDTPAQDFIILPFDADELFYSLDSQQSLGDALRSMPCDVAVATVYDHVPTPTDESTGNPLVDMIWRMPEIKSPPSVAFRYHPDAHLAMGNHSVGHPGTTGNGVVGVRHFQYRSLEQYKRKLRNGKTAYEATDLPEMYGAHWRLGGAKSDEQLETEWNAYINRADLIYDPAPMK